jgi:RNA-splicing ligase RtcB
LTAFLFFIFISGAITLFSIKFFIAAAVMGAACYGSFRAKENSYKEFEYTFTNGNLEIDVIYNKKKRKKILDEDVKNFADFGAADEININGDHKVNKCYPWDCSEKQYVIISGDRGKEAYYIAPDENILKYLRTYFTRRPNI